jgi:hypothetical protein
VLIFGLFAILTVRIVQRVRVPARRIAQYLVAAAIAFICGLVSEAIQIPTPRDANLADLCRNAAGILCFLGYDFTVRHRRGQTRPRAPWRMTALRAAALCLGLLPAAPVLDAARYMYDQRARLPLLTGFDNRYERAYVSVAGASLSYIPRHDDPATGEWSARVAYAPSRCFPRLEFAHPYADWSSYRALCLDIDLRMNRACTLAVRIHDTNHNGNYSDRFTRSFSVKPGPQTVCFGIDSIRNAPHNRAMNMQRIEHVALFAVAPVESLVAVVDNVRLAPARDSSMHMR